MQILLYDAGQMDDPAGALDAGGDALEPDIVGLFDDDSMDLSADGRWITVQGQDLTTLYSGKQWPPLPNGRARRIPTGKRLDVFVSDMIQEVAAASSRLLDSLVTTAPHRNRAVEAAKAHERARQRFGTG